MTVKAFPPNTFLHSANIAVMTKSYNGTTLAHGCQNLEYNYIYCTIARSGVCHFRRNNLMYRSKHGSDGVMSASPLPRTRSSADLSLTGQDGETSR